jgi:sugar phosphate permease
VRKVYLRILPFVILTYFFCYLDRINVGFVALTMNKDTGLDPAWYGMASGAFFWGYVLFARIPRMIPYFAVQWS